MLKPVQIAPSLPVAGALVTTILVNTKSERSQDFELGMAVSSKVGSTGWKFSSKSKDGN